jgi:hypothetical protein
MVIAVAKSWYKSGRVSFVEVSESKKDQRGSLGCIQTGFKGWLTAGKGIVGWVE